jgi:NADH-quinone oxidoreductase subunit M
MPWAAVGFIVGGLVSMGMPGFSGFIAEFPIFMGVWRVNPVIAIVAAIAIVITAAYILLVVRRVFFGTMPSEIAGHMTDISVLDKVAIGLLVAIMVALGWMPTLMTPWIESTVTRILALVGGA